MVILWLCLAAFFIKAFTSIIQQSATWDETTYFGLGKYILQHHRWDAPGAELHPPLSYFIHDIPLLFVHTDPAVWTNYPSATNPGTFPPGILRGRALLSSPANQGDRLLTLARLMMVLTGMLLGYYVYLWSHSLYGKWGAILAVIWYSFCPNILANAGLITPDITVTAFSFIALYYFWRLLSQNHMRDALLGGFFFGLALLSKFTSVLLFPVCLLLAVLWGLEKRSWNVRHCVLFALIGILILFVGYGFNLYPYFNGIFYQSAESDYHKSFLMGRYSTTGWWYYFIVAFLIKTPVATMILLCLAGLWFARRAIQGDWVNEMFLLVPAAVIFAFFSFNHQSIGLRYILPVYPFLFVFAGAATRWLASNKVLTGFAAALAVWYIAASSYIHPHYLAYFNEFVGGPANGYKYLVDSNLDWGQDLPGLKRYLQEHHISRISLSYFGSDSPSRYGISYNWLPSWILEKPGYKREPTRWVAISATNLQGVYSDQDLYAWFRSRQPVAEIGYSIFIYQTDN